MRILHICQRDDPGEGGALRVAEALVREQRCAGADAWLLFLYGPPAHFFETLGPQVVCLGLDSSREALKGVFKLAGKIRLLNPDIIHSHDGITWPRLVFMGFRIPVVMHSHLPVDSSMGFVSRLLIRYTTDFIAGISLHTIGTWVKAGYPASRIHHVPNGVDFNHFQAVSDDEKKKLRVKLGLPENQQLMLWVGRLHEQAKGTDRVERLAALMPDNITLVMVGNGPSYKGMLERCQSHIAEGRIIMVGSTSSPEVYYKVADLFLFTSYQEAFGLVILEAVASGLPLIVFPVTGGGGAVNLLKEFSSVALNDSCSDDELREKMERLSFRDDDIAANLEKARSTYSLDAVSNKVVDIYKIAMKRHV